MRVPATTAIKEKKKLWKKEPLGKGRNIGGQSMSLREQRKKRTVEASTSIHDT